MPSKYNHFKGLVSGTKKCSKPNSSILPTTSKPILDLSLLCHFYAHIPTRQTKKIGPALA